jgi:2-polyprenyl-3-methyl-5-hydroxy-6-metoxy-1,4-benzoquinol methylase
VSAGPSTRDSAYAERLQRLSARGGALRRFIDPQRPYRWNLRRLHPGEVLDIGCGIGRNLTHLDGHGVGVDHNADCVAACRAAGLTAYTSDEFPRSADAVLARFDTLLVSHVVEHMDDAGADALFRTYLPFIRRDGRVIMITPQERGQRSDATHVQLIDDAAARRLASRVGLEVQSISSFPLPRVAGHVFTYNETVAVLARPTHR